MNDHVLTVTRHPFRLLEVSGIDASEFLQNMTTQDIPLVNDELAAFALLCNSKGRVLSQFLVIKRLNQYYLLLEESLLELTLNYLKQHVFRKKVTFNVSPNAIELYQFSPTANGALSQEKLKVFISGPHLCINFLLSPPQIIAINITADGSRLYPSSGTLDYPAWKNPHTENGLVCLTAAISGKYLPQALNYLQQNMVSLKKGCYVGQEIINRVHNFGEIKQELRMAVTSTLTASVNEALFDEGRLCGNIVDIAISPHQQTLLAVVEKSAPDILENSQKEKLHFKKISPA